MTPTVTLRLPTVACNQYYPGAPAEADVIQYMMDFYRRLPIAKWLSGIPLISIFHRDDPACPADIKNLKGITYPGDRSMRLNAFHDIRTTLAHELGHELMLGCGVSPTGDFAGQQIHAAWCGLDGPDDNETFASAIGAYLLGLRDDKFFRWFPLALDVMRRMGKGVSGCFVYHDEIHWDWTDPTGASGGPRKITNDGRLFACLDGMTWKEQTL